MKMAETQFQNRSYPMYYDPNNLPENVSQPYFPVASKNIKEPAPPVIDEPKQPENVGRKPLRAEYFPSSGGGTVGMNPPVGGGTVGNSTVFESSTKYPTYYDEKNLPENVSNPYFSDEEKRLMAERAKVGNYGDGTPYSGQKGLSGYADSNDPTPVGIPSFGGGSGGGSGGSGGSGAGGTGAGGTGAGGSVSLSLDGQNNYVIYALLGLGAILLLRK